MQDVKRALVAALVLGACAMKPAPLPASHPASPRAQTGRLAGPPPSLRAGVVDYKDLPTSREEAPPAHHHHGH